MNKLLGEIVAGGVAAVLLGIALYRYYAIVKITGAGATAAGNLVSTYATAFLVPYPSVPGKGG